MTNASENATFFSFDRILKKESIGSFNVFLTFEDIPEIATIYSYKIFHDAILNKNSKRKITNKHH